jgi:UrcA family protein
VEGYAALVECRETRDRAPYRFLAANAITPPLEITKMFNTKTRATTVAALFFATLAAIPSAASAAETRSVAVQSGDLDLAKGAGRAALQQRIAHAVKAVCGPDYARTTADIQAYATCSGQARVNAGSQFDAMVAKAQTNKKVALGRNN